MGRIRNDDVPAPAAQRKRPEPPMLPATAGSLIKALVVTLGTTGLITGADAECLVQLLRLEDA